MPVASSPRQLALALDHAESFARDDFLEGASNASALALIDRWPDWPAPVVALAGPQGSGKSHLASIWAERAGARVISARALTVDEVPAALATGALVIEDLAAGDCDEAALFHLLNLAREDGADLLFTAQSKPASMSIALRDLASRLRAVPVVTLDEPDDHLLRGVLGKLFADRQLAVDEALLTFLVSRMERSLSAARKAVETLDREALRRGRPVNRSLAAELYREMGV
jgi:chromosomal replication initiation ATPase DnaA